MPIIAVQDLDARLWQDPVAVAQKQMSAPAAGMAAGETSRQAPDKHTIEGLAALLQCEASRIAGKILLLGVMIDAGPSQTAELRLRTRQAVLAGLSESGFIPNDGEHIGYVTTQWPIETADDCDTLGAAGTTALLIPWEQCEAKEDPARAFPIGTARVVVLWLPAGNFSARVLRNLGVVIDKLAGNVRRKIDVTIMGPANSTGLQSMIREVRASPLSSATQAALDGVSIVSARATAPDAILLYEPSAHSSAPDSSVKELLEQSVARGPRGGLHFFRTIANDKEVLQKLLAELQLRWRPEKAGAPWGRLRTLSS